MLKFLRKYRKSLLAVGGTILMIAFLLPDAATRIAGNPMKRAVAEIDGRKVRAMDLTVAEREMRVLSSLDERLREVILRVENGEHWLLLAQEAEAGGFVGGPGDGQRLLRTVVEPYVQYQIQGRLAAGIEVTPDLVAQLTQRGLEEMQQKRRRLISGENTEELVDRAMARAQGVLRMYDAYLGAATLSGPEAEAMARRYVDAIKVDYALMSADQAIASLPEPTEEQIAEQFERFKNVAAGSGEHGFGYLRKAAVKMDWIRIDRAALEKSVKADPVKAYTHWDRNKSRFGADFAAARDAVEKELHRQAVDEAMLEAERIVRAEIVRGERALTEDGRFKKLPADWESAKPDYSVIGRMLFDTLRAKRGVMEQPATAPHAAAWMTKDAIVQVTDIGKSRLSVGPQKIPFDRLVFSTRELDPSSPYGVQAGVTAGPTQDDAGNVYFFRVYEVRPESPPESLEEVRSLVATDLKRLAAYEAMAARADEIRLSASHNFEEAAKNAGAPMVTGVSVLRTEMREAGGMGVDRAFNTEEVRTAIMDRGGALDPTKDPVEIPFLDRTLVIPLPRTLGLAIVRITSLEPVSLEAYRRMNRMLDVQAKSDLMQGPGWPFALEAMKERHSFKSLHEERAGESAPEAGQKAEAERPATPS